MRNIHREIKITFFCMFKCALIYRKKREFTNILYILSDMGKRVIIYLIKFQFKKYAMMQILLKSACVQIYKIHYYIMDEMKTVL